MPRATKLLQLAGTSPATTFAAASDSNAANTQPPVPVIRAGAYAFNQSRVALMLVGITLILGIFEKLGAFVGVGLLALYYLAHPSFPWLEQLNVEGSYWFVNKNLIELAACLVLYQFPTGQYFGLNYIIKKKKTIKNTEKS